MELAFETKSLREICESPIRAKRALGESVAEMLKRRLADLRAATCIGDLIAGRPQQIEAVGKPQMTLARPIHDAGGGGGPISL